MDNNQRLHLQKMITANNVEDNTDLIRCQMLCMEICFQDNPTVESIKNSQGYKSCICNIPDSLISEEAIQAMINF